MSTQDHYEILVIGSGEGGKYLAWHMARNGHRTAVVERRLIGGSCPNTNCLPSKNEIWSAKVADLMRHGEQFGSMVGATHVDMARWWRGQTLDSSGLRTHSYAARNVR